MPELQTKILPLLPLTTGVVLPGMVVTVTLETPEARTAVAAATTAADKILLVPRPGREHPRRPRRAAARGVPSGHRRARLRRRHGRVLPRPLLRAEGRGPGDPRRRAAPGEGPRLGQDLSRRHQPEDQDRLR